MNFKATKKYKQTGTTFFEEGDNLRQVTKSIPDLPGVYLFHEVEGKYTRLKYIGSAGTIKQDGKFKGQMLRGRINNKMNSQQTRSQFFKEHLKNTNCDLIRIDWYVTYDEDFLDLPKYVEALMVQEFYGWFGSLPDWNKEF